MTTQERTLGSSDHPSILTAPPSSPVRKRLPPDWTDDPPGAADPVKATVEAIPPAGIARAAACGRVQVEFKSVGGQGNIAATFHGPGGTCLTEKFDVAKRAARDRIIERITAEFGEASTKGLAARLEEIAAQIVAKVQREDERGQEEELVGLCEDAMLFHTPGGYDSEGYAEVSVLHHRETWAVESRAFKRWLGTKYFEKYQSVPNASAIADALTVLAGRAIYEGPEREVHVRVAGSDGAIYLDLGDSEWRVVEVTSDGWRVIPGKAAPVRFVRRRGMLPLPVPERGGQVLELRRLMNVPDDASWVLLVACVVGYLRPTGPYPILIVDGEQGSAKSTACRFLVRLIDPRKAALRRPPTSERDLMIAASNAWLVGFDNLSCVRPWLSDTICSLATGGGFSARRLYTDGDEKVFDAMRPVLMNGIDRIATRSDLLDRAVHLHLPNIPEESRVQQRELDARFASAHPRVLGALLDAVSAALKAHASVQLERTPRLADFAAWVTAAEPALGWRPGTFLSAYLANREETNALAIESSPVGPVVESFMQERDEWEGTAQELLDKLKTVVSPRGAPRRKLPKTAVGLSRALRRLAPNLRACGLVVEFLPREGRRRPICLSHTKPSGRTKDDGGDQGRRRRLPPLTSGPSRGARDSDDGPVGESTLLMNPIPGDGSAGQPPKARQNRHERHNCLTGQVARE